MTGPLEVRQPGEDQEGKKAQGAWTKVLKMALAQENELANDVWEREVRESEVQERSGQQALA